jgi:hypothetical protein
VIGAGKQFRVAPIGATNAIAAVTAEIEMRAQAAVQIAAQDDRFFAHIARDEIPWTGNLAFMAKIKPAMREYPFAFQLVDLPVGEDAPVDEPSFRVDESFYFHPTPPSVRRAFPG